MVLERNCSHREKIVDVVGIQEDFWLFGLCIEMLLSFLRHINWYDKIKAYMLPKTFLCLVFASVSHQQIFLNLNLYLAY